VNAAGEPAYFALTCGAARLELAASPGSASGEQT